MLWCMVGQCDKMRASFLFFQAKEDGGANRQKSGVGGGGGGEGILLNDEDFLQPDPYAGMENHKAKFKESDVSKILILAYPR